jgi:hypothetical protein
MPSAKDDASSPHIDGILVNLAWVYQLRFEDGLAA